MHSIRFYLSPPFVHYFMDSGVLSINSWCLALSKMFKRWRCQIGVHYSKSTYDIFPGELEDIFVFDTDIGFYLHPLAKVVICNEQKLLLCCSSWQEADYVHPLLCKRPMTCDRVEGFRRYTENGNVSLTSIAYFDITFNVLLHGGSIVSLRVGTMCQSSSAWVIATYALMEFG